MQAGRKEYVIPAAVGPESMLSVVGNGALRPITGRVRRDLVRVVEEIAGS